MTYPIINTVKYDGLANVAGYTATKTAAVKGFVVMSAVNWTIKNATASSTTVRPVGVVKGSIAASTTEIEVVRRGYVYMYAGTSMTAGNPVFPSDSAGAIINTGATDASGNVIFAGGFGTVVVGATTGNYALVQLQGLI